MAAEKRNFQAEVSKLLEIVVNSLYSNKEIFLRELISNASDACDRLRYAALTEPHLLEGGREFRVTLSPDKEARTLTVADNGIGMNRDELIENLGTIARSGTAAFLAQLSGDARKDVALIGQFGVGFYSAFMVAERVEVIARKAGDANGWRWSSDGKGEFVIDEEADSAPGTRVILHLRAGEDEYLDPIRLRGIVKTYSDHIALPVVLVADGKEETINAASALWTRPKSAIAPDQYKEFYHHVAHAFDDPWLTIHYQAEGAIEYTGLLFVPSSRPFDLFDPGRRQHVRLCVRRVFITDAAEGILPPYLRFLRGVVDSQDLPLNVSRELLQTSPVIAKMRAGLVKRVLADLKRKADDAPEEYLRFWTNFGAVLKEGLYEDFERRDELLDLCRFDSSSQDKPVALADYVARMKEGQAAIYYLTGDEGAALKSSPQLEGFAAKGVEVLLLSDPIDEFWPAAVDAYKDKPIRSAAQSAGDLAAIQAPDAAAESGEAEAAPDLAPLLAAFKTALGEQVREVRASERLTESPVCLVAADGEMSIHLERLLRQHRGGAGERTARILEVNPKHKLIRRLAGQVEGAPERVAEAAHLLLDQARLVEGESLPDPIGFGRRLAAMLERGV